MRRTRAPGVIRVSAVALCVLAWPLWGAAVEDGTQGIDPPASDAAKEPATQASVGEMSRQGRGFVCERRVVEVAASGASFKVAGVLAVTAATCQDCCVENVLFLDGFENGSTSLWSATVP